MKKILTVKSAIVLVLYDCFCRKQTRVNYCHGRKPLLPPYLPFITEVCDNLFKLNSPQEIDIFSCRTPMTPVTPCKLDMLAKDREISSSFQTVPHTPKTPKNFNPLKKILKMGKRMTRHKSTEILGMVVWNSS